MLGIKTKRFLRSFSWTTPVMIKDMFWNCDVLLFLRLFVEGMPGTQMVSLILLLNQVTCNLRGSLIVIFRSGRMAWQLCKADGWARRGQKCPVFSAFPSCPLLVCMSSPQLVPGLDVLLLSVWWASTGWGLSSVLALLFFFQEKEEFANSFCKANVTLLINQSKTKWERKVIDSTHLWISSVQSRLTLHDPMDRSMPGFPVHH